VLTFTNQAGLAVYCASNLCEHRKYSSDPEMNGSLLGYGRTLDGAGFLSSRAFSNPAGTTPEIVQFESFREGQLVFFRILFTDPDNNATGFGFKGINGAGWAEENHPFSNPSYGRVAQYTSPAKVEYPFNLECGTASEYQTDVEVWIYTTSVTQRSNAVDIHLTCSVPDEVTTPFPSAVLASAPTQ
jgi:hypothetical protein